MTFPRPLCCTSCNGRKTFSVTLNGITRTYTCPRCKPYIGPGGTGLPTKASTR